MLIFFFFLAIKKWYRYIYLLCIYVCVCVYVYLYTRVCEGSVSFLVDSYKAIWDAIGCDLVLEKLKSTDWLTCIQTSVEDGINWSWDIFKSIYKNVSFLLWTNAIKGETYKRIHHTKILIFQPIGKSWQPQFRKRTDRAHNAGGSALYHFLEKRIGSFRNLLCTTRCVFCNNSFSESDDSGRHWPEICSNWLNACFRSPSWCECVSYDPLRVELIISMNVASTQ